MTAREREAVAGITRWAMEVRTAAVFGPAAPDRRQGRSMSRQQRSAVARFQIRAKPRDDLSEPYHAGSSQRKVNGCSKRTNCVFAWDRVTSVKWA